MRIIEEKNIEKGYEFNSWGTSGLVSDNIRIFDLFSQYNPEELQSIFSDPMANNKEIRILCRRAYNLNPIVSNAIDYIVALPCLAHILIEEASILIITPLSEIMIISSSISTALIAATLPNFSV